ncbi:hypothetical protein ERJ75_000119100 [Trypanosoma vivax]|nr:hypothetical protein ERJ75_000119100 [Trypanosoma vivax]
MTQRRGNARALCVAALCALWPRASETAVKHALLQPKAKLLCDVSKALKAVAATAGKKDATIAALEGAATKHAGPLVRAAAAWHTCAASGAEKCSTLREKSATAARWHRQQTRPRRHGTRRAAVRASTGARKAHRRRHQAFRGAQRHHGVDWQ